MYEKKGTNVITKINYFIPSVGNPRVSAVVRFLSVAIWIWCRPEALIHSTYYNYGAVAVPSSMFYYCTESQYNQAHETKIKRLKDVKIRVTTITSNMCVLKHRNMISFKLLNIKSVIIPLWKNDIGFYDVFLTGTPDLRSNVLKMSSHCLLLRLMGEGEHLRSSGWIDHCLLILKKPKYSLPKISTWGNQLSIYNLFLSTCKLLSSHFQMNLCGNSLIASKTAVSFSGAILEAFTIDPKLM